MASKKSSFLGLGELSTHVICPGCGIRIDTMRMIKGEYDTDPAIKELFPLYGWGILTTPFVLRFALHWSWVASILIGIVAGFIAEYLIAGIIKSLGNRKV